jgi:hypothetical protein
MKRTVIMRDRDLIAFLNKERKNPLFTDIEVEPLSYKELQEEILVERIKHPEGAYPSVERTLPNLVETVMYKERQMYDQRYFKWMLTYDYPDGDIYVQTRHTTPRQALNRVTVTYEKDPQTTNSNA